MMLFTCIIYFTFSILLRTIFFRVRARKGLEQRRGREKKSGAREKLGRKGREWS